MKSIEQIIVKFINLLGQVYNLIRYNIKGGR